MSTQRYDYCLIGGTGFIGSALGKALSKKGSTVLSVSRHVPDPAPSFDCQAMEISAVEGVLPELPDADMYFVLVGQNHKGFDARQELAVLTNIVMAINAKSQAAKVISTSSVLAYGNCDSPANEDHTLTPIDVYSQFKKDAEEVLQSKLQDRHALGIARLANVYGQPGKGFIGVLLKKYLQPEADPMVVNGDGHQTRDYIYIEDVIGGLLAFSSGLAGQDTVNIATGKSYSLREVIKYARHIWGKDIPYTLSGQEVNEISRSSVSPVKLANKYAFHCSYSLESGLKKMLEMNKIDTSHLW